MNSFSLDFKCIYSLVLSRAPLFSFLLAFWRITVICFSNCKLWSKFTPNRFLWMKMLFTISDIWNFSVLRSTQNTCDIYQSWLRKPPNYISSDSVWFLFHSFSTGTEDVRSGIFSIVWEVVIFHNLKCNLEIYRKEAVQKFGST